MQLVSTGVGNTGTTPDNNTGTTPDNNVLEITNNNTRGIANNNTQEIADILNSTQSEDTFDIQEVHTTNEDEEEPHEEPTTHNEEIVGEMNTTNMRHDPEVKNEISETAKHMGIVDESPERPHDDQVGNTTSH